MKGYKVVLISRFDRTGCAYRIAEAVNMFAQDYSAQVLVQYPDPESHFHTNVSVFKRSLKEGFQIFQDDKSRYDNIISQADIIHLVGPEPKDEYYFHKEFPDVPIVQTVTGKIGGVDYTDDAVDLITFISPLDNKTDNGTPFIGGTYIPDTIHSTRIHNYFPEVEDVIRVGFYDPNMAENMHNGFEEMYPGIYQAVHIHPETRIQQFESGDIHIFYDGTVGFYSNIAIEAMARGIPVRADISDDAIKFSDELIGFKLPVIHDEYDDIMKLDLQSISTETKMYCESTHSYLTVSLLYKQIYDKFESYNVNE